MRLPRPAHPRSLISALLLLAAPAGAATGGVALTISHSGYLLDANDHAVTDTLAMTFRVYDALGGGNVEWEGTCASVSVRAGYYTALLGGAGCTGTGGAGDQVLDSSDLPVGAPRWLEAQVGATVLTPRLVVGSVPNAAVAAKALDSALFAGQPPTAYATASHPHDATAITSGKLDNARLHTGTGNGLDADTVDGQHAADFAAAGHGHVAAQISDFVAAAVSATAGSYAAASHTHATASGTTTGLLSATDWTRFDGKLSTEADPKVGTLTNGKWCTTDGTKIDCTSAAPVTTGGILNQATPQAASFNVTGTGAIGGNLTLGGQVAGFRLENLATSSAPTCDAAHKGYMYFDATANRFLGCNGVLYRSMDGSTSGDLINGTQTYASDTTTWGSAPYAAAHYNITNAAEAASHCVQSDNSNNHWYRVDFGTQRAVTSFGVSGYPGGSHKPTGAWYLQGSNDASNWAQLWTGDGSLWTADTVGSYPPRFINTVTSPGMYRYYRVTSASWTNAYMIVCNLSMYE